MHVVIVGAGEVGWYLAERLGAEQHDVVVIEQDEVVAAMIREELDVQVVVGNACQPSVLLAAGVERAALLAGVTQSDEVNLIASLVAKHSEPRRRWCGSRRPSCEGRRANRSVMPREQTS